VFPAPLHVGSAAPTLPRYGALSTSNTEHTTHLKLSEKDVPIVGFLDFIPI